MDYFFYASKSDKINILKFLFKETEVRVYDFFSEYEKKICEYKSISKIVNKFDLENGNRFAVSFHLWASHHKGFVFKKKVILNPRLNNGFTYRYVSDGWGLIKLFFGGIEKDHLNVSTLGHLSKADALLWESTNTFTGRVSQWNWQQIRSTMSHIKKKIHNEMAVKRVGKIDILAGAAALEKNGIQLD